MSENAISIVAILVALGSVIWTVWDIRRKRRLDREAEAKFLARCEELDAAEDRKREEEGPQ